MKFIVLAAVFAVAAANNAYNKAPVYSAPSYKSPAYSAPAYSAPEEYPAQPYSYSYNVKDEPSYNDFIHSESTDGKVTTGSYKVALPDGRTQIVSYKADSYGYNADVKYEGEARHPEYKQSDYKAPAYPSPTYSAPAYSAPAYKAPEYKAPAPAYKAPAYSAPAYKAPTPAYKAPAYSAPAYPKY
ncbi:repetitive proline-rich cell wall protein 1-like [Daphnia pulicaria]|uniref:repetitive proline-rich cell wall protein 1-like n=1 Tax=Daphnia pulicaria TaxID=35523 RepID=UPI001EEA9DDA|nr:repetitive proline-rich cell wall protein 1-like [Daphnia pulicaria]